MHTLKVTLKKVTYALTDKETKEISLHETTIFTTKRPNLEMLNTPETHVAKIIDIEIIKEELFLDDSLIEQLLNEQVFNKEEN